MNIIILVNIKLAFQAELRMLGFEDMFEFANGMINYIKCAFSKRILL